MASIFVHPSESSSVEPGLQATSSLSTLSSTSDSGHEGAAKKNHAAATTTKVNDSSSSHQPKHPQQPQLHKTEGWSTEEQDQFIALILPHINGKRLSDNEIRMIRAEARDANLPDSCVDRLLAESQKAYLEKQQTRRLRNYVQQHSRQGELLVDTTMEEVDESDNILAYFSRMASLKQGGHFPRLNTDALASFVETTDPATHPHHHQQQQHAEEDVEVDWDVGYVNRTLDLSLEESYYIQDQHDSWEEYNDDSHSHVSTTVEGRNRYLPAGYSHDSDEEKEEEKADTNAFESLLVGGGTSSSNTSRHVTWDTNIYAKEGAEESEKARQGAPKTPVEALGEAEDSVLSTSLESKVEDPVLQQRERIHSRTVSHSPTVKYCYGYEEDLDEWTRKRNIALWQSNPKRNGSLLKAFACQTSAEDVVVDELRKGLGESIQAPSRLQGMAAVKRMMAQAEERRQHRQEVNERRHVPKAFVAAPKAWHLPYRERCQASPGYVGVDQYSMMESTAVAAVQSSSDPRDSTPWELRDVKQHFLYEQSAVERNWFGRLRRKRGNDPNKFRPPRVRSMEMPVEGSDASSKGRNEDSDWTESGANSKTTASKSTLATNKSWKTNDDSNNDGVNKTASISYTSGEETEHDGDDEKSSRYYSADQSQHSQSMTTRSVNDGISTLYTEDHSAYDGNSTLFTADLGFGTMADDVNNTFNSFLGLTPQETSMSMDADEIESTGVSEILDADDHSDDEDDAPFSLAGRHDKDTTVQALPADRYVSSFSETSTASFCTTDDHRSGGSRTGDDSASTSGSSCSSSSFCTSDSSSSGYSDDGTWEDAPECGTFTNVKPKLGERVSRVTPDHTSHLLRSRFRKKHFPRGSFPYDK